MEGLTHYLLFLPLLIITFSVVSTPMSKVFWMYEKEHYSICLEKYVYEFGGESGRVRRHWT